VDVSSPAEFNGEIIAPPGLPETAQWCGHIPGAANVPWAQAASEDGTFKSADELRALYAAKGITPLESGHCVLPHRASVQPHLVRAERATRLRKRAKL
jgi:thiosulfate/3-mercaptopyruvate sulfurtransferase